MLTSGRRVQIVYEDDKVVAFLDKFPQVPGHTLVVPKEQVEKVHDMKPESAAAVGMVYYNALRAPPTILRPLPPASARLRHRFPPLCACCLDRHSIIRNEACTALPCIPVHSSPSLGTCPQRRPPLISILVGFFCEGASEGGG